MSNANGWTLKYSPLVWLFSFLMGQKNDSAGILRCSLVFSCNSCKFSRDPRRQKNRTLIQQSLILLWIVSLMYVTWCGAGGNVKIKFAASILQLADKIILAATWMHWWYYRSCYACAYIIRETYTLHFELNTL